MNTLSGAGKSFSEAKEALSGAKEARTLFGAMEDLSGVMEALSRSVDTGLHQSEKLNIRLRGLAFHGT